MTMIFLKVLWTNEPGGLEEGEGFEFTGDPPWELGRAPHYGPELKDRSISRRHAVISLSPHARRWRIENVSRHNGVFVDGDEVIAGEAADLPDEVCHVQLGSVVFELKWLEETRPFTQAIDPARAQAMMLAADPSEEHTLEAITEANPGSAGSPMFSLTRDGDCCAVHCKGKLLSLKPSCALAFYSLCKQPGEVVHGWDMLDEMGGEYDLPQAISGVRRELRGLMKAGWLTRKEIIMAINSTSALHQDDELQALDEAALLRRFLISRRGHGYALMLPQEKISLNDEG